MNYTVQQKNIDFDPHQAWCLLQSGDQKGLEVIYRLYAGDMYRFGMSLVRDDAFISDMIQEVFLSLWKYQANLPAVKNVKFYLFKSLSNKIKKEKGKVARHVKERLALKEELLVSPSPEEDLIQLQQNESLQRRLAQGIENLPFRQKELIHYLFFEKASYEECSRIFEINIRSVYTLAWKAIKSLRKHINF